MATAIVLAGAAWVATTPVNDLDSYWHVQVGREIVARHRPDGLGLAWLGVPAAPWRTSQWLSEVLMYGAVDRFGWLALPVLRLLTIAALFAVLAVTLARRRQPIAAFVVVLLTVAGLEILLQDRPATVSLVFLALLGPACERLWTSGVKPPPLAVAGATLLWAQLHGLWVLAPAAFALVALGALAERRRATPGQLRGALVSTAAATAGLANPQGVQSFLLPLRFRAAAGTHINEWLPTNFTTSLTISWGILVLLLILLWVRSPVRVPTTELLWSITWSVFAVTALRNVGPAILLTAPVVLRAFERNASARLDRMAAQPSPRTSWLLAGLMAAVLVLGAASVVSTLVGMDPLKETPALRIARRLAAFEGRVRVWNDYNTSGTLIAFAGGRDGHVQLVVDGRSDLWGGPYIQRIIEVQSLRTGWQTDFDRFAPDAAVLTADTPLASFLLTARGWRVVLADGDYVLIAPPRSDL